jgi:hypothetical protein
VLVHGLGSNPDTTWLAKAPEDSLASGPSGSPSDVPTSGTQGYVNWVTDLLIEDLKPTSQRTTRVYFFNYDSYWKRDALKTRLRTMAGKLLHNIKLIRTTEIVRFALGFT